MPTKLVHHLMLKKNIKTYKVMPCRFDEDFLIHHANVALSYIRLVEKEVRRAKFRNRLWFRHWQEELSKSTIY